MTSFRTPHEVDNTAKVERLVASMEANGWVGNPILVDDEDSNEPFAFTGTHRIEAARIAGIDVPTYSLESAGVDIGTLVDRVDDEDRLAVILESGDEEAIRIMREEIAKNEG